MTHARVRPQLLYPAPRSFSPRRPHFPISVMNSRGRAFLQRAYVLEEVISKALLMCRSNKGNSNKVPFPTY